MDSVTKKKCRTSNGILGRGSSVPRVLLLAFFIPCISASSITWLPNLEWNTEANWADGFVPRNGSHVVFPVEMRLSVGLPVQNAALDLAGLELPRDGALALPQSGSLTISQASPSAKTAHWSREGPLLWVEPNNWNSERSTEAAPHLERIPCRYDVVVLPGVKRTLSIQLPNTFGTNVQAVRVTDDTGDLPPWEWRTVSSQREFSEGPMSVGYTGLQSCIDCSCQTEPVGRQILQEVCATPGASCPVLACEYPVTVEGHCCHYCGGRVVLPDTTPLSLAKTVANLALESYGSTISWYTRRRWDSKKEILVAVKEKYSWEKTVDAVTALTSVLKEQGIKILSVDTTGGEVNVARWVVVVGPIFGTLLMILALLLVAFPYFGYPLPQVYGEVRTGFRNLVNERGSDVVASAREATLPRKPFRFAKFENAPEAGVELDAASTSNLPAVAHANLTDEENDEEEGGGRFTNPLYLSGRKGQDAPTFAALKKLHEDIAAADEEVDLSIES